MLSFIGRRFAGPVCKQGLRRKTNAFRRVFSWLIWHHAICMAKNGSDPCGSNIACLEISSNVSPLWLLQGSILAYHARKEDTLFATALDSWKVVIAARNRSSGL